MNSAAIRWFFILGAVLSSVFDAGAQRQMEKLGRGVVALRTSSAQVYVGWRLLGTDPDSIGFNLYRTAAGGAPLKLNSLPLTNTTDYVDTTANLTLSNAWFVRPVLDGVEQSASLAYGLPANAPTRQYFAVPLQAVAGGAYPPYDVKFCWVGDLDGDGEYDFVVDRLSTTGGVNQYLQAYKRDGTFLWQMDMGYNSTNQYNIEPGSSAISTGDKDNVTVYDLDGDGRAEVIVRVARGTVLPDGTVVTGPDDTTQYLSVLDGLTGKERSRVMIPNPFITDGPLNSHLGIIYCDGVHPSVVLEGDNRVGSGPFNEITMAWDFKNGQLTQRWQWTPPSTGNYARGHQIRIADVNHDGIDDIVEIGSVNNGLNGQPLFDTELLHGDREHITDMDPDRPGLETFSIQQNNPTLLATALYESGTGKFIKRWYSSGLVDVGRGIAIDIDPNHRGYELYSTQPGIFDCKGNQIFANTIWPPEGLWWDADLSREFIDGAGSGAMSPVVNKFDPVSGTAGRLYTIYNDNGGVHQAYGGRPAFWGDIFGDWREELVLVANDYSEIRIYLSTIPANNRLYCLMQNPAYRAQATLKGYYEACYPDYYLGTDMQPPPPPPNSDAKLVWRGGGANSWDAGGSANWLTNNLWISNTTRVAFSAGDTVLFDLTGTNSVPVNLVGTLAPGAVTVYSPIDYVFGGSGALAGAMKLTKVGGGSLTLSGTNTFSGSTTLWEGPLLVNGSLTASPVVVRSGAWLDAAIGGLGFVGGGVTVYRGGSLSPGCGSNSPGRLTISNGVTEINGAFNRFHLSDDSSGMVKTNDLLNIIGNLSLVGTNTIFISPINTNLSPGIYTLIKYSGSLIGGLTNLMIGGIPGVPAALTNPPGAIALVVKSTRPPGGLTWAGGPGTNWDLSISSNWFNGGVRDLFVARDSVRFDNTGAPAPGVNLLSSLPVGGVVVDATNAYAFAGAGGLSGSGGLTKTNSGTLTMQTVNDYTGRTIIGGGVLEAGTIDMAGVPSALGASGNDPSNLVFYGSTLRYLGTMANTDHGATLNGSGVTIDVPVSGGALVMTGPLLGGGGLIKNGVGTLTLNASNSYSGGTLINSGIVQFGTFTANQYGVGSGLVMLNGGTLSMIDIEQNNTAYWNLYVPTNASGGLAVDGRCGIYGTLTGGGTLNVSIPFVRSDFNGNWSAFNGWVSVNGANFRCGNSAGYPKARMHVNSGASLQNRVGGTPTIPIGELSGDAGSTISASGGNDGLSVTWRVGGLNTSVTFDGTIANGVGFIKEGAGSWTLTGNNTYSGGTTVNGGNLVVNNSAGSGTGSGAVTVAGGGALGGSGAVAGAVTVAAGGMLVPSGTFTISNNLALSSASISQFDLGRVNDRIVVVGNLALAGLLNITNSGDFFSSTNILFTYSGVLSGPGLSLGVVPPYFNYALNTNTPGQVKLIALSTVPAPLAPTSLRAAASNAMVCLSWSPAANTVSYHVKRSGVSGGPYADLAVGVTGTNYTDLAVTNGYGYYYVVSAVNGAGQSANTSPQAAAAPPGTIPDVPTGLAAVAGNQMAALSWNLAAFATTYNVKRSSTNGGPYTNLAVGVATPAWYDSGLTSGKTYYYVVSSVNLNGESAVSAQVSATPFSLPAAYWTNQATATPQSWNVAGNWTNASAFPNAVSAIAVMGADLPSAQTNTLNQNITLGALYIGDANNSAAYTLSGNGGTLIFDNNGIPAQLAQTATSKGDTVSAPITVNGSLVVTNASANLLTLSGNIAGAAGGIVLNGNANLSGTNTFTGGLVIGQNSTVYPGSIAANGGTWGTGPINLLGGTVQFNGYGGSVGTGWGGCTNTINVPVGQTGTLLLPPRWGYSSPFTSPLVGGGTLNVTVDYIRDYFNGNWSAFTGQINVNPRSGSGDFRINNASGYANAAIYLAGAVRFGCIYNATQTIDIGELAGETGTQFGACDSQAGTQTWRVGGRNTSATYAGTVTDGAHAAGIIKVGAGTWTLTGANTYSGATTISGGTLQIGAGGASGLLASSSIINNANLAFNRSDDIAYGGNISGTGALTKLGAGALTLTGANTYFGLTQVGAGSLVLTDAGLMANTSGYALSNGAVLDARSLSAGLTLANGQTLGGNGTILGGVTVGDGAAVSPGDGIGALTFNGSLALTSLATCVMEIAKLPLTNDQIIASSVIFGGTLMVSRSGAAPFTGGEVFKLFSVGTRSGAFAGVSFPALAEGLIWDAGRLYVDGTISIASTNPPQINAFSLAGNQLLLNGSGGTPGRTYYVLTTTNIALPVAQWPRVATNQFDAGGAFSSSLPIDAALPQSFYRLQVP